MTPSKQAKAVGLKSLAQVVELSSVSKQTLSNWRSHKPELFHIVLLGCLYMLRSRDLADMEAALDYICKLPEHRLDEAAYIAKQALNSGGKC